MPKQCTQCEKKLRPANTPAREAPGTRQHAGKGLCKHCHWKQRKAAGLVPPKPVEVLPVFDERLAKVALEGYMNERRLRLARNGAMA